MDHGGEYKQAGTAFYSPVKRRKQGLLMGIEKDGREKRKGACCS